MADPKLTPVLRKYVGAVTAAVQKEGDPKVYCYFFQQWYHHGCGGHPDMQEHKAIAAELEAFIRKTMNW
jgi:hypothetical protein